MSLQLETLSQAGTPPKSRLKDATSCRTVFTSLLRDDEPSNFERARIQGNIDGNPPYDESELELLGQAGRTNVNWGEAGNRIEQALLPHYDVVTSVEHYATITTDYGGPTLSSEYSRIISDEFHRMLSDWDEFLDQIQLHQSQLVIHGIGPIFWRDEKDWRSQALLRRDMLVPSNAKASRSKQKVVFIKDKMEVDELYQYIKNEDVAEALQWDVGRCKTAIRGAANDMEDRTRNWEWWQQQLKDNTYYISYAKTKVINVIHALVVEFGGRVSHHILTRDPLQEDDGYLYSKVGRFSSINQAIWMCFDGIGNGDFKSVRGAGWRAMKFGEVSNRANNTLWDNLIQSNCVMWKAQSAADVQRFAAIEIGPNRIIPPNFEPLQLQMGRSIQDTLQAISHFQLMGDNQLGQFRSESATRGNPETAEEIRAKMGEKAKLTSSKAEKYLNDLDKFYFETFRRASNPKLVRDIDPGANEALDFQKRCIDRGVPSAVFQRDGDRMKNICSVKATRSIGSGSSAGRIMAMQQLAPIVLTRSPEEKQKVFIRDLIGATSQSQYAVDRYGPDLTEMPPGQDEWDATQEETSMIVGGPLLITPDQNHMVHAAYHIRFMAGLIKDTQAGALDPRKASAALDEGGPHTLQHIQLLESDKTRKEAVKEFKTQMGEIMRSADEIKAVADRLDKQEAEQEQGGSDEWLAKVSERVNANYKDMPEDVKRQIEFYLGLQPSREASVPERTLQLKQQQLGVKAAQTDQRMALDDTDMALKVREHQQEMLNGNGKNGSE